MWEEEGPMPTRNRSTTESGRGETDEAGLVADTESDCITQLFHLETLRARKPGKTALPHIVRCLSEWDGAVRCPERSCAVARMVSGKGLAGRCKRCRVIPDNRRDERPAMSSQPPYQTPPQGYGPNQPQGGWEQRQYLGFQTPTYGMPGSFQSPGSGVPLFASLTMGAGVLSLTGSVGPWATAKAFGVEVTASGMDTRAGVFTLLFSIAIVVLAGLSGFLPAMKRLFWSMAPAGILGLINLIMVFSAMANIGKGAGQCSGLVQASMGWGLILLLISSIAVIALATIHVIQMLNANRRASARPGFGGGPAVCTSIRGDSRDTRGRGCRGSRSRMDTEHPRADTAREVTVPRVVTGDNREVLEDSREATGRTATDRRSPSGRFTRSKKKLSPGRFSRVDFSMLG
mgnify:CR=1 FL=1